MSRILNPLHRMVPALVLLASAAFAQAPGVHTAEELEHELAARAGVAIELPERGYTWADSCFTGDRRTGAASVEATRVIYYFLHWGPVEVPEITDGYTRVRIPRIWPGEGLEVQSVEPSSVAGHPAMYVEVRPRRPFYRAFFLIWKCPESGRQFIADMNYNVMYHTPHADLETEIDVTRRTLACHVGAPTAHVAGCDAHYDSPRFGLRFDPPLSWYVFENPWGVPHPAYAGVRDRTVGSLLAWFQDMTVELGFNWSPLPAPGQGERTMGGGGDLIAAAASGIESQAAVTSFRQDAYETISLGGRPVFKLLGTVEKKTPPQADPDFVPRAGAMAVLMDDAASGRRFLTTILIDHHRVDGGLRPPVRDIFDRLASAIATGLAF